VIPLCDLWERPLLGNHVRAIILPLFNLARTRNINDKPNDQINQPRVATANRSRDRFRNRMRTCRQLERPRYSSINACRFAQPNGERARSDANSGDKSVTGEFAGAGN